MIQSLKVLLFISIIINLFDKQHLYITSRKHIILHKRRSFSAATEIYKKSSIASCSIHCFSKIWCKSVSFNLKNADCHLHNEATFSYDEAWAFISFCANLKRDDNLDNSNVVAFLPLTRDLMNNLGTFGISGTASFSDLSKCKGPARPVLFVSQNQEFLKIENKGQLTLNTAYFTWTAWFLPLDASEGPLFNYQNASGYFQTHIWYQNQKLFFRVKYFDDPNIIFLSEQKLIVNEWNTIGLSFDAPHGKVSCIINGKTSHVVIDQYVNVSPITDGDVFIGSKQHYDPRSLNGYLAWICLYNDKLILNNIDFNKGC